jgi:hypothetical protein
MDGQRFDEWAKDLARLTTRRGVLKGLTGSAAGSLLALVGLGSAVADVCKPTGKECKRDGQCCSGSCVPPTHSQSTAGSGSVCCAAGQIQYPTGVCCTPTTCAALGKNCGEISDGCGGTLNCGTCSAPQSCGGGGAANACGCTPTTCAAQHATCGSISDGCGGDLTCGTCPAAPVCQTATCSGGTCVTAADPARDGESCGGGKVCRNGTCACPSGTRDCGGTCRQCCADSDCPGATCSAAVCIDGACGLTPIEGCCTEDGECDDGDPCTVDTCDPTSHTCRHDAAAAGTPCDDGNPCTVDDACDGAGTCATGSSKDCAAAGDQCNDAACDTATGTCVKHPKADGTGCDDGNPCTSNTICQQGACGGGTVKDCSAAGDQCNDGVCNPATGNCVKSAKPDGTPCDDGVSCSFQDICRHGVCGNPSICESIKTGSVCVGTNCVCPAGTHDCDKLGCKRLCGTDRHDVDRFQVCLGQQTGSCLACIEFLNCYGPLDTGTSCGTVSGDC